MTRRASYVPLQCNRSAIRGRQSRLIENAGAIRRIRFVHALLFHELVPRTPSPPMFIRARSSPCTWWPFGRARPAVRMARMPLAPGTKLGPYEIGVRTPIPTCWRASSARHAPPPSSHTPLEKTFARGWGKRDWIEHDPDYDSQREDPRFQAMLQHLK